MTAQVEPGQRVTVHRPLGGSVHGEVLSAAPDTVTVRTDAGKRITVPASRIRVPRTAPSLLPLTRTPSYELGTSAPVPKSPPSRSTQYLAYVRQQPCCSCATPGPSDPHHWAPTGRGGGMGLKCDDLRTVPLCRVCHDSWHQHGCLPGRSVDESREMFLVAQVDLLVAWRAA